MRSESYDTVAFTFSKIDYAPPPPTGRNDGVFTVILPSLPLPSPPTSNDEVLVGFEFGDSANGVDGRDFLIWQRGQLPDTDVAIEKITIVHEGFELI